MPRPSNYFNRVSIGSWVTAAVWEELRHKSARQLGTTFEVTGVTSGTGSYSPPKYFFQTSQTSMSPAP
jgi:hypothetical protein